MLHVFPEVDSKHSESEWNQDSENMLAMYLKYHKAGLTPTTSVTSTAISSVKMAIGHTLLTNLRSEMIFLQGKPVFYILLPSTPPY
jgi:hypothetical protein